MEDMPKPSVFFFFGFWFSSYILLWHINMNYTFRVFVNNMVLDLLYKDICWHYWDGSNGSPANRISSDLIHKMKISF